MTKKEMIEFLAPFSDDTELAVFLDDKTVALDSDHMIEDIEPVKDTDWPLGTIIFFVD